MAHDTVRLTRQGAVTRVALDRPDVRNAFNDEMLVDLVEAFTAIRDDPEVRVAVLTGEGSCFCAGADVNWMKRVVDYTQQENYEDSLRLALMLHEIYSCPKPVIARINGPAIGGGTGLVAVCDIAIADEGAIFGITETKLGVIPAAISPYLLKRMGERNLKEYTLTGERFKAPRAAELGLINAVAPARCGRGGQDREDPHWRPGGPGRRQAAHPRHRRAQPRGQRPLYGRADHAAPHERRGAGGDERVSPEGQATLGR
ncbi:MAG: enoyl-CoA hydratase-related protein [Planctomycetota bacterium]|jgi:methylglutaconyl-CoA hydratase